jgi:hypothetical protein
MTSTAAHSGGTTALAESGDTTETLCTQQGAALIKPNAGLL